MPQIIPFKLRPADQLPTPEQAAAPATRPPPATVGNRISIRKWPRTLLDTAALDRQLGREFGLLPCQTGIEIGLPRNFLGFEQRLKACLAHPFGTQGKKIRQ